MRRPRHDGQREHLAPGEDIRSARFYGDVGFVVTFKKTDPLYTPDFSSPESPKVRGELKIPGFSTYMHMIDEGQVMRIGHDADDQAASSATR
ncbi:beta-propeller domain-containing protein [Sorangium sp. So ce1335]|uniref:beta-propeller domain-containing protein n=1 Tax=Sorangium sp. So ce1335 TaxID=3133335 RepID=UPI003F60D336